MLPEVKRIDSKAYIFSLPQQIWPPLSVQVLISFQLTTLPTRPQDMVDKVVQYLCLHLWQVCWDTLCKSLHNISSFIKQYRYDVTFEPGDPYESHTTLLNNVKLAGAVLAASNVLALSYISIEMHITNGSNSHIQAICKGAWCCCFCPRFNQDLYNISICFGDKTT